MSFQSRIPALLLTVAIALAPASAGAATKHRPPTKHGSPTQHRSSPKPRRRIPPRRGGKVYRAWPARGGRGRPATPIARWLAKQVGPAPRTARHDTYQAVVARTAAEDAATIPFQNTAPAQQLFLVRSYQIPANDPLSTQLANLSWTYDSAITAIAFTQDGYLAQAQQLLSQLSALQRTDGSIDFAFNTSDGQSIPEFRAGTVAWAGLAAVDYRASTCQHTYDPLAYGAAKWLLGLGVSDSSSPAYGLVRGGPDVTWVSTQHNLAARAFLAQLATVIDGTGSHADNGNGNGGTDNGKGCAGGLTGLTSTGASAFSAQLHQAVALLDAGINKQLFVRLTSATGAGTTNAGTAYFREGVNDDVRPVDAQALGALWLLRQGRSQDAQAVVNYADQTMLVTGRSVALSSDPFTFNGTYSAPGPFSGYLPYADPGAPNVLWMEGTLEMLSVKSALADDTTALQNSVSAWLKITGQNVGPLQANGAVSGNPFNEYHPWPAAAPGAWTLLNGPSLFTAS